MRVERSRPSVAGATTDARLCTQPLCDFSALTPQLTRRLFCPQFCGICHSDLHTARGEWGPPNLPTVPGHELTGVVTAVGAEVTKFKIGDKVGVGCMVNSCRTCRNCSNGNQQYCKGSVFTYNTKLPDGRVTYGGYSTKMVCDEAFVFRFPDNLPLDKGAPLLCAGITVYNPMVANGLDKPGTRIGVIGLGGAF